MTQYVALLFAGTPNTHDIQQEILQNTLDRYDDLIAQGKSPEAAYRLSIAGIGDLSEILEDKHLLHSGTAPESPVTDPEEEKVKKQRKAAAIAFYILSPVPLFILTEFGFDTLGLCLTLLLVAAATALLIMNGKEQPADNLPPHAAPAPYTAHEAVTEPESRKNIRSLIWGVGLVVYFIMSFATKAWYITWLVIPLIACVQGLTTAILDLKEAR